jgi:hypothetical protein
MLRTGRIGPIDTVPQSNLAISDGGGYDVKLEFSQL